MNRSSAKVLPAGDFETRFFAALAALASLLVHVALLVLFFAGSVAPPPPPPLVVEIVSVPREPKPPTSEAEPDEPLPPQASPAPPSQEPELAVAAEREPEAPLDFRARIRRREEAFQQDMAVRRRRVAALERFLAEQEASAPVVKDAKDVVTLCGARDPGPPVAIEAIRSMARYADLTPVGLFPPRYLDEVAQVAREGKALGFIEMALPAREVIVQLDEPAFAVLTVGRRDTRCLVGFSWSPDVFPLRFRGLPARYIDADDTVRELVMDVVLHVDATFELTVQSGDELPFSRGSLYDQEAVARNLEQRATGARMVRDFLGALLGR